MAAQIYLIRHGETEWSNARRYAGRLDIALTDRGEGQGRLLGKMLERAMFAQVWVSPLRPAIRTCELAGLSKGSRADRRLIEWDFGKYEGSTTSAIRAKRPGWSLFRDGCPGGESAEQLAVRVESVIKELQSLEGCVALFSHKQFLRSLAVRWIGLPIESAGHFSLDTGSLSVLSFSPGDTPVAVISRWNAGANGLVEGAPQP